MMFCLSCESIKCDVQPTFCFFIYDGSKLWGQHGGNSCVTIRNICFVMRTSNTPGVISTGLDNAYSIHYTALFDFGATSEIAGNIMDLRRTASLCVKYVRNILQQTIRCC